MKTPVNHQFKPGQFVVLKHPPGTGDLYLLRITQIRIHLCEPGMSPTVAYQCRGFKRDGNWCEPVYIYEEEIDRAVTKPPEGWAPRRWDLAELRMPPKKPERAAKKKGK